MIRLYSSIVLTLLITCFAHGQSASRDKIYSTYDQIVGLDNTALFNGTEFTDLFLNTDGTYRYLDGFDYTNGSVVYKDQYYVGVQLKYDLLEDNLLTRSNDNLSIFNLKLIPEFVSEFTMHNRHFVQLKDFGKTEFFELAFEGNTIYLYIKHKRVKREKAIKSGVQYSFKASNFYLLKYKDDYIKVESIRDVTRAFPNVTSEIRDFHKSYRTLYKQDKDGFMAKLAAYLDKLPEMDKL